MKQSRCCVFDFVAVTRWRLSLTGCFLALSALLCSPVAAQTMGTGLINAGVLPADSEDAYSEPFSGFFSGVANDPSQDIPAAVLGGFTTGCPLDPPLPFESCMAGSLGNIPKAGGNVAVVDWILVQLRLVPQGAQAPNSACRSTPACRDQVTVVTKAALLLSDGSVSSADAGDLLAEGVLTFDDVDFDPATQDMYIAVNHRNHLPVLSGKADDADTAPTDGDYVYDFITDPDPASPDAPAGFVKRQGGLAVITGDPDGTGRVSTDDLLVVNPNVGRTGYFAEDIELTSRVSTDDLIRVNDNIGRSGSTF